MNKKTEFNTTIRIAIDKIRENGGLADELVISNSKWQELLQEQEKLRFRKLESVTLYGLEITVIEDMLMPYNTFAIVRKNPYGRRKDTHTD